LALRAGTVILTVIGKKPPKRVKVTYFDKNVILGKIGKVLCGFQKLAEKYY
jgi:hypothetical protein